jgi:hypothetical protein
LCRDGKNFTPMHAEAKKIAVAGGLGEQTVNVER